MWSCRLGAQGSRDLGDYCLDDQEKTLLGIPLMEGGLAAGCLPSLISLDCEMVRDVDDKQMLARVALIHQDGSVLFDEWLKPPRPVARYKTHITGATPELLGGATMSLAALPPLASLVDLSSTILCGHGLSNDFRLLPPSWHHPHIIDTCLLFPHPNGPPSFRGLDDIVLEVLGRSIQVGSHDPREDAKATIEICAKQVSRGYGRQFWFFMDHPLFRAEELNPSTILGLAGEHGLDPEGILAIYLIGSRGMGTAKSISDWDFILIVEDDLAPYDSFIRLVNVDMAIYSASAFRAYLLAFSPGWHECVWSPPENIWLEKIDFKAEVGPYYSGHEVERLATLRTTATTIVASKLNSSRRAFREGNVHRGKNQLFVAMRFLSYSLDLARYGSVKDIRQMNWVWEKLSVFPGVTWLDVWSHIKGDYFGLLGAFHKAAPIPPRHGGYRSESLTLAPSVARPAAVDSPSAVDSRGDTGEEIDYEEGGWIGDFLKGAPHPPEALVRWLSKGPLRLMVHRGVEHPSLVSLRYSSSSPKTLWTSQCRGIVFDTDDWSLQACPFERFFPLGSPFAPPDFDWSTLTIEEKVDGSIAFLYWYKGTWLVGSASTPEATGPVGHRHPEGPLPFAQLFWEVWEEMGYPDPSTLSKEITYVFELISPKHVIIVRPPKASLPLLGTFLVKERKEVVVDRVPFERPRRFSLEDFCDGRLVKPGGLSGSSDLGAFFLEAAACLDGRFQEGWVLKDGAGRRLKVKSPTYTQLSWLCPLGGKDRGAKPEHLLKVILADAEDEFRSHCGEHVAALDRFKAALAALFASLEATWASLSPLLGDPKAFALEAKTSSHATLFFKRRKLFLGGDDRSFQTILMDPASNGLLLKLVSR